MFVNKFGDNIQNKLSGAITLLGYLRENSPPEEIENE
jgi:hypothetical protein